MATEVARYSYEPLEENHIRVVDLLPGLLSDALRCRIRHVKVPGDEWTDSESSIDPEDGASSVESEVSVWPDYEALSYVWGPQDPPHNLCLDGETSGFISIGPNLHNALQRIRPRSGQYTRTLWVDQICINQNDLSERSVSVSRMGEIFGSARRVLIWLGEEDQHTALGFDFARRLYELSVHNDSVNSVYSLSTEIKCLQQLSRDLEMRIPAKYMVHHSDYYGNDLVEEGILQWCAAATRKLSYRDWFDRTWTYQEVKLAKEAELISGSQSMPWKAFEEFLSYRMTRSIYTPNQGGLELSEYLNWSRQSYIFGTGFGDTLTFQSLLDFRKRSKCSDPRDKVIALLSLADEMASKHTDLSSKAATEFICPDYQKPVEDLYVQCSRYIVQDSCSIEILTSVVTTEAQHCLPSWVPDWRQSDSESVLSVYCGWFKQATKGSSHEIPLDGDITERTRLRVKGIKQDRITALSCYDSAFRDEFFGLPSHTEKYLPTMQPRALAIMQSMMREQWTNTSQAARAAFFGLNSRNVAEREDARTDKAAIKQQLAAINKNFNARDSTVYAFNGSKGFIGFIRGRPQVSDEIYLLLGIDTPVVLRPVEGGYKFVGCCYVHGLMYGEGLHPDRKLTTCYYPGSSDVDEFWPLEWTSRKERERNAPKNTHFHTIAGNPSERFRKDLPYLIESGHILHPDWVPPWTPPGEDSVWLFEMGFNPILILTEDIVLV